MIKLVSRPHTAGATKTEEELNFFIVLPRVGTISPWSSKATNIAQMCNLDRHVQRVERGQAYLIRTTDGKHLSEAEFGAVAALVHDRMTQAVLNVIPDEKVIFKVGEAATVRDLGRSSTMPQIRTLTLLMQSALIARIACPIEDRSVDR